MGAPEDPCAPRPLVIIGTGGLARRLPSLVAAINGVRPTWRLLGLVSEEAPTAAEAAAVAAAGSEVVASDADLATLDARYVIGIGASPVRRRVDRRLRELGLTAATLVHPAAVLEAAVSAGEGGLVMASCSVQAAARLGRHVHVGVNATVGHDVVLGDHVSVAPQCVVGGGAVIGAAVHLGAGSVVVPGRRVGEGAVVGAGAIVTRDVPAGTTVVGSPARPLRPVMGRPGRAGGEG